MKWGVVIDLRKCIGCKACTALCTETNNVPLNTWRRIVDCGIGELNNRQRVFVPMSCMHCSKAPCLEVCPATATRRRSDGIIDIDYDLCIGCGYCVVACPYRSRSITYRNKFDHEKKTLSHDLDRSSESSERVGVCTKCDLCHARIDRGLSEGLKPGVDPDATPVCIVNCTAGALYIGDMHDPDSIVSRMKHDEKTACIQEKLGTEPSVYYIVE